MPKAWLLCDDMKCAAGWHGTNQKGLLPSSPCRPMPCQHGESLLAFVQAACGTLTWHCWSEWFSLDNNAAIMTASTNQAVGAPHRDETLLLELRGLTIWFKSMHIINIYKHDINPITLVTLHLDFLDPWKLKQHVWSSAILLDQLAAMQKLVMWGLSCAGWKCGGLGGCKEM